MLARGTAKDQDIVKVGKTEIQVFKDVVSETLEGLDSVSEATGHERKFRGRKECWWLSFGCRQGVREFGGRL
jgi:hypothetical protein